MDQNQSPSGRPASATGYDEAKQVPPPPQTPEIKLRTMESDVGSIQKTGGATPTPEFIASPLLKPETKDQTMGAMPLSEQTNEGSKKINAWLVVLVFVLILAAAGYFYIWPIFFPTATIPEGVTTGQPAVAPTTAPKPALPSTLVNHESVFGFPNDIIPKLTVADASLVAILTALQNEAAASATPGELREVVLVDTSGKTPTLSEYLTILMPELADSSVIRVLQRAFENDFTAYLYFDEKGVWPGYIVSPKSDVDIDVVTLQDALKGLETASFSNLFLTPPGTAQDFRTGTIKSVYTNRFAPLTQSGASFNYGLFDGRLIINTSYSGLLKALDLMGL